MLRIVFLRCHRLFESV